MRKRTSVATGEIFCFEYWEFLILHFISLHLRHSLDTLIQSIFKTLYNKYAGFLCLTLRHFDRIYSCWQTITRNLSEHEHHPVTLSLLIIVTKCTLTLKLSNELLKPRLCSDFKRMRTDNYSLCIKRREKVCQLHIHN